jgi:hypothetical protein
LWYRKRIPGTGRVREEGLWYNEESFGTGGLWHNEESFGSRVRVLVAGGDFCYSEKCSGTVRKILVQR